MAKTQTGGERSAIEMLTQDHKRVQKLFKDFEKVDRDDEEAVRELVETACLELQIHSMLEEEIFYPAVRGQTEDPEQEHLLNKAEIEHETVDDLIAKLHELEADDPMYSAYFEVLSEYVRHHIKEEEQELFPAVEAMNELDLGQLGDDMRLRREELFAEMERGEDEEQELEASEDDAGDVEVEDSGEDELEDEQEQIEISRTRH
jgi:hemerythrin-like domain-containing protein